MGKYKIMFFIVLLMIGYIFILHSNINNLNDELSVSKSNEKAFIIENSGLKDQNRVFQFTVGQLEYFNDSLITKMNGIRKELKIKDNNLKQMQYLLSEAHKKDTIIFRDTLFKEPTLDIDTIIGDKWYNIRLGLKYPNLITTNPIFTSEKYLIVSKKRETINPPKKFFLFRWFQRKHWVMEVNIKEKNPYIKEVNNKFVEIIK